MIGFLDDFVMGWRSIRKGGFVSWLAIVILALGVGANSALFSVVDTLLLQPLPIPDAEAVVVMDRLTDEGRRLSIPIPKFFDFRDNSRGFEPFGGFYYQSLSLTGTTQPARVRAVLVTSEVLPLLTGSPRS